MNDYDRAVLSDADRERLQHVFEELTVLAGAPVPSVRAAARAAMAQIAQALNGQGITFDLYTAELPDR